MVHVVAAIVRNGDEVFACRRASHKVAAGKWEFPGGKIEDGESPQCALEREILEELGIRVLVGDLLLREATEVDGETIDLAFFETAIRGGLPTRSTDHDELRWFHVDEIDRLDWALPDIPAVRWLQRIHNSGLTSAH